LSAKVVAVGPEELYYLLRDADPDFGQLFKVWAEFGDETGRSQEVDRAYGRFIARMVHAEKLLPFEAAAVAEVIRFGVRLAGHREKLSVDLDAVADLVREANHWAGSAGSSTVAANHVRQALEERIYRSGRIAAKIRELIAEGVLRLSLDCSRVGQVNGVAVIDLGDLCFGRPGRVTASAGIGQEGLVNIERESDLSGSSHNKGVLILEGYLRNRYARQHPIALSASVAFEQSYAWVEGDSASLPELLCLLSALGGVPLRQDIAVTGSVNQHGEVQAVGAVAEKVEGFFDACRVVGLTRTQGVCLPRSNVRHLILRDDVVEAVGGGRFHLWAVDTVDEAIELLTGMQAGDIADEGTFHHRIDQCLQEILGVLQEEPAPEAAPRLRVPSGEGPQPLPPPLPGERG
jgi:predicted ATP-dependent protease